MRPLGTLLLATCPSPPAPGPGDVVGDAETWHSSWDTDDVSQRGADLPLA